MESGARAAAAGGFTAVVAMPNTEPPVDGGSSAIGASRASAGVDSVDIVVAGALTKGRAGKEMADFDAMYEVGVRVFSDDGDTVPDAGLLRRVMAYLRDLPGALVAEHAEDRSIARDGHMHEGRGLFALGDRRLARRRRGCRCRQGHCDRCGHRGSRSTSNMSRRCGRWS